MVTSQVSSMNVIFVCGGSGGHIYPALSTARVLLEKYKGITILFITTQNAVAGKILKDLPEGCRCIALEGPKRPKTIKGIFIFFAVFIKAFWRACNLIRNFSADIVVGYGGYLQVPVLFAAAILRKSIVLHEQNVHPGIANRIMALFAKKIAVSFHESIGFFMQKKVVVTGLPVRSEFTSAFSYASTQRGCILLVTGGSQGAHSLNMHVVKALSLIPREYLADAKIFHVCGEKDEKFIKEEYQRMSLHATVYPFYPAMHELYAQADIVIARAGAGTIAEISSVGLASILIPYPYAGKHQYRNAEVLVKKGAGFLFDECKNTPYDLSCMVQDLILNKEKRIAFAKAAGLVHVNNAAERFAAEVVKV